MSDITHTFEKFKTARRARCRVGILAEIARVDQTIDSIQSVDPSDDQIRYGHVAIISKRVMLRSLMKYRQRLLRHV